MTMTILVISCNTEKEEGISYNATVLGKGLDCGETFLIQFNDNTDNLNSNNLDNIFYAINLSNEYKIENLEIKVTYREPLIEEILSCTTLGPEYTQIFIIETEM